MSASKYGNLEGVGCQKSLEPGSIQGGDESSVVGTWEYSQEH